MVKGASSVNQHIKKRCVGKFVKDESITQVSSMFAELDDTNNFDKSEDELEIIEVFLARRIILTRILLLMGRWINLAELTNLNVNLIKLINFFWNKYVLTIQFS